MDATVPSTPELTALRADHQRLQHQVEELLRTITDLRTELEQRQATIDRLVRLTFGRRSERLDGANALQIFRHITLPLIRPVLIAALMLWSLDNLKEFDMIYTITQGGPGIASETLYLYSYQVGFGFFKAGYGSALMVVVFLIVLVFNVVMNRLRLSAQDR